MQGWEEGAKICALDLPFTHGPTCALSSPCGEHGAAAPSSAGLGREIKEQIQLGLGSFSSKAFIKVCNMPTITGLGYDRGSRRWTRVSRREVRAARALREAAGILQCWHRLL